MAGIRNFSYDTIRATTKNLKDQLSLQSSSTSFFKSENSSPLDKPTYDGFINSMKQTIKLAEEINQQFYAAKKDMEKGLIVEARYKEILRPLHDLLTDTDKKIVIDGFDTSGIISECKKFGLN